MSEQFIGVANQSFTMEQGKTSPDSATPAKSPHVARIDAATGDKINPKVTPLVEALNGAGFETSMSGDLYGNELVYVDLSAQAAARVAGTMLPAPWTWTYQDIKLTHRDALGTPIPPNQLGVTANIMDTGQPRRIARPGGTISEHEAHSIVAALTKAAAPINKSDHDGVGASRASSKLLVEVSEIEQAEQLGAKAAVQPVEEHTDLTDDQRVAVAAFRDANGRDWKQKLGVLWMTGNYGRLGIGTDQVALLQQVRNQFGPEWLVNVKRTDLDAPDDTDPCPQRM